MIDLAKIIINPSPLQDLKEELFEQKKIKFYLKRDDLLHPQVSGNKWRKLKYNILKMSELGLDTVLTFGGAFSNHIYSTAAAGKIFGFKTIGIIRGDELNETSNETLKFASENGMKLIFVSRTLFREIKELRTSEEILAKLSLNDFSLIYALKNSFIVPEGGTTNLALKGVGEMAEEIVTALGYYPIMATAVGSGGTLAGICSFTQKKAKPLGISVLKNGNYVFENIDNLLKINEIKEFYFEKKLDFHHGGYGKTTPALIGFMKEFEKKHGILIEQVYTGKLLFALYKLIEENYFPENSTIVAIHTGGLQGRNFN